MCVCVCLVLYNNICILPVSFALLPLSIIVFVLFPSFPFAVMGYLLIFLRCLCVNSFFSLGCEGYIKRQPTSNNVTSASIILPVTCCSVGHKNAFATKGQCVCVRVCVRVLLLKASSCRARQFMSGVPWAEISVQIRKTSKELVVQRGAHQRSQGRSKTASPAHPRQSQYLWT